MKAKRFTLICHSLMLLTLIALTSVFSGQASAGYAQKQAQIPGGWLRLEDGTLYFSGQVKLEGEFRAGGTINSGNTEYTTVYEMVRHAYRFPGKVLDMQEIDGFIHILIQENNWLGKPGKNKRLLIFHQNDMISTLAGMLVAENEAKSNLPSFYIFCGLTALELCANIDVNSLSLGAALFTAWTAKLFFMDTDEEYQDKRLGVKKQIESAAAQLDRYTDPKVGEDDFGQITTELFEKNEAGQLHITLYHPKSGYKFNMLLEDIAAIERASFHRYPDSCSQGFQRLNM